MRLILVAFLAMALTAPLAACGKQGPLRLPMTGLSQAQMSEGVAGYAVLLLFNGDADAAFFCHG